MPTLKQLFEFSQLAQAAYAHLENGSPPSAFVNNDTAEFSLSQATVFLDDATGYSLLHHQPNDSSGFSASLFRNNSTGGITITFRGTEGLPLNNIDPCDIAADADIVTIGYARQQIISAYNYYQQLITPVGQTAQQLVEELTDQPPTDGRPFTTLPGTTQFLSYRVVNIGEGLGKLSPTDHVTVTGHSLGGHLAVAFSRLFSGVVDHVYTYNAPGFGTNFTDLFFNLIPGAASAFDSSKITNVYGEKGPELIADLHTRFGGAVPVFIETATHSKRDLTDALALYDLLARMDPSVSVSTVTSILNGSAATAVNSLEQGLDAFRKLFQGSTVTAAPIGDRDSYYANLLALQQALSPGSLRINSLVNLLSSTVFSLAKSQTLEGLSYRYALRELNPFVVTGIDYEALHNQDHSLDLYDANTGVGVWTQVALSDRAELLTEKLRFNQAEGISTSQTLFVDEASFFNNQRGAAATDAVIFGDAESREYVGRRGSDHIYGGAGEDTIRGAGGQDYLEGNGDNDRLFGEADNDILLGQQGSDFLDGGRGADRMSGGTGDDIYIVDNLGDRVVEFEAGGTDEVRASVDFMLSAKVERLTLTGAGNIAGTGNELDNTIKGNSGNNKLAGSIGNDLLEGGIGFDTYIYHSGDGLDRIEDSDAQGQIIFDDHLLQGGIRRAGAAANSYASLDGRTTYVMSGTDLIVNGVLIVNENFQSGQMGIQLRDISGSPHDMGVPTGPFTDTYIGDDGNNDYVGRSTTGSLAIYANGGNDTLYGDHAPPTGSFQDLLDGGAGNDVFFGGYGDDYLIGGSGDDYAFMTGGDIFLGEDGDDYAVGVADFWDSTGPRIGSGAHYADGGAGNDMLLGEIGGDVLLGGAGDDILRGENRPTGWVGLVYDNFMWNRTAQAAVVSASGGDDYLDGGAGNDLLVGDGGNDILIGGAGDDRLYGESDFAQTISGDDWLDGGEGNDWLAGGAGADFLSGGDGDDLLIGDFSDDPGSADILDGGAGADELQGGGGDDILYGGTGMDRLAGFAGNDVLDGGADNDEVQGGIGDDSLWGGLGNDRMTGQEGDDTLFGDEEDDELQGDVGNDTLFGGTGHDALFGQDGNDLLSGEAGDDLLIGGLGNDQLDGGDGIDDVQGREGDDVVIGGAGDDFLYGDGNDPTALNLLGGNDTLDGEEGDDQLWGGAGQDQLFGGDGADQLVGDVGDDALFGNAGDDSLFGDSPLFVNQAGYDILDGGDGNDVLQGGGGDDDLHGGAGNDLLIGGDGLDTYRFNLGDGSDSIEDNAIQSNRLVFGAGITAEDLSLDVATGDSLLVRVGNNGDALEIVGFGVSLPTDFHSIRQFEFADGTILTDSQLLARGFHLSAPVTGGTVLGTAYADHIEGSQVEDWIHGRDGNDILNGGQGDDVLEGEEGDDELDGGAGNDRLYGSAGSNVLRGGEGNDLLDSAGVGDQLFGGVGDDGYHLRSGSQTIDEALNAGTDTIYLTPAGSLTFYTPDNVENVRIEDDVFLDPALQVNLVGNALDNVLSGSDRLDGQAGNDTLIGLGDNTFVFGRGYGHDTVETGTQWYAHTGLDQVEFVADIAPSDLVLENHANDLVVKVNGTTDQLTVQSYFVSPSTTVDQFVFAGGTVWGLTEIESRVQTFVGSEADETFYGTVNDDTIRSIGGNDQIRASSGNDTLDGGTGNDFLEGSIGNDLYVFGVGYGQDVIDEQGDVSDVDMLQLVNGITPGDITLRATPDFGSDAILTINGTSDQVTLAGFFLFDSLRVDRIQFSDGTIWDYNAMLAHTEGVTLEGTEESDFLYGNVTNDSLSGLGGDDSLNGGAGHDTLLGGAGVDELDGSLGNDLLDGGADADTMVGGSGNDIYVVDNVGDGVTEQPGQGTDTVQSSIEYSLGANLENLTLIGSGSINGTGNSLSNTLTGNSATNVLTGGTGNDTYVVGIGDVVVEQAGSGTDTIQSSVSWTLGTNVENLTLTGGQAIDGTGNTLSNLMLGNNVANLLNGMQGADRLIGGQGDDTYVVDSTGDVVTENVSQGLDTVLSSISYTIGANIENLTLTGISAINGTGNSLNNMLVGNSAANRLTGGAGDDTYVIAAGDTVVESSGGGTDTVQSSVTHTLGANVENLTLTGTSTINGTGNALNNVLTGNNAANVLTGGSGNDTYVIGTGDSIVENPGAGTDIVQSSITYTLGTNLENLTLTGTTAINGTGNASNNSMSGNSANNVLAGLGGNDTYLYGRGGGQDTVIDTAGTADSMLFGATINPLDLVLSRQANDLRLAIHGNTDQVTIQNWYGGTSNQVETLQAGDGKALLNTQVDQLIQAMASFSQQTGLTWDQAIDQRPQDVQTVLAANWH